MKKSLLLSLTFLAAAISGHAQIEGVRPVFHIGGGPTLTTNHLNNYVKNGFNFTGGGGIRAWRGVELLGEFNYNELGVQDQVIQTLQVPDGNARIYSVTGNLRFPLSTGRVRPYVIGGGGWYRRTVEFTEPSVGAVNVFDP
jgi:hypothetical protein